MKFRISVADYNYSALEKYPKLKENFQISIDGKDEFIFIKDLENLLEIENLINEHIIISNNSSIPRILIYDDYIE